VQKATLYTTPFGVNLLTVTAQSSLNNQTQLRVKNFGSLNYNRTSKVFSRTFLTNRQPTEVVVASRNGTEVTAQVQRVGLLFR
jgi:hypothetical protein